MSSRDRRALLARLLPALCFAVAAAWCQEWSGSLVIVAPGTGKPLTAQAYIPDLGRPVRAAMVLGWAYNTAIGGRSRPSTTA